MEKLGLKRPKVYKEYFIAIVPPDPAREEAQKLKAYFKDRYNSKASLNSPPHITLHMPFRWLESKEAVLTDSLKEFFSASTAFQLSLRNFSGFPPRVIFIGVEENMTLNNLQRQLRDFCKRSLNLFNANYRELPFHAHLTLAFRDLKKDKYEQAWEEFSLRQFHYDLQVEKAALLKHDGKVWHVYKEFQLNLTKEIH
ncbi:MAG: 2'-5' RNA ligase family protein [Chryseolinea sp.]